jgi:hypothetical protein
LAQTDCCILYAKNAAGTTELFLRDEAGNILQLTAGGKIRSDILSSSAAALLLLNNNVPLQAKNSGGTARTIAIIDAADNEDLGSGLGTLLRLNVNDVEKVKVRVAGTDRTIFHAANSAPTILEDAASDYTFTGAWAQATGLGDLAFTAPAYGTWVIDIRLFGTIASDNTNPRGQYRISEKIDAGAFAPIAIGSVGGVDSLNPAYYAIYTGRRRTTVASSVYTYRFEFQRTSGTSMSIDVSEGGVYGYLAAHRTG